MKAYKLMSHKQQLSWNSKVASQCFAVVASILNLYGLAGKEVNEDYIWGNSPVTEILCGTTCGYLLADTILFTVIQPDVLYDKLFLVHHVITFAAAYGIETSRACAFIFFTRTLSELSNIPLNMVWFLKFTLGKSSAMYVANGVVFTITFALCRIVILPYYYLRIIPALWNASPQPPAYCLFCIPAGVLFDIINLYWFFLIVKGLKKVMI